MTEIMDAITASKTAVENQFKAITEDIKKTKMSSNRLGGYDGECG